jgi:hypothetical protein
MLEDTRKEEEEVIVTVVGAETVASLTIVAEGANQIHACVRKKHE